jgi:hypothetical protein
MMVRATPSPSDRGAGESSPHDHPRHLLDRRLGQVEWPIGPCREREGKGEAWAQRAPEFILVAGKVNSAVSNTNEFFEVRTKREKLEQRFKRFANDFKKVGELLASTPQWVMFQGVKDYPRPFGEGDQKYRFPRFETTVADLTKMVKEYQKLLVRETDLFDKLPKPLKNSQPKPPDLLRGPAVEP